MENENNWKTYWEETKLILEDYLKVNRVSAVEEYIESALSLYSFITEDIFKNVTKHKDLAKSVYPLVIQLNDIVRAALVNQKELLLSSSATNLRAGFEISCNLSYIFRHESPSLMLERLAAFTQCEEIIAQRTFPGFNPKPNDIEIEKAFAAKHPYWATSAGLLKESPSWTGEKGVGIQQIISKAGKDKDYYHIYKATSKFTHGSPVVINAYRRRSLGISPLGKIELTSNFNINIAKIALDVLLECSQFFGVVFPTKSYTEVQIKILSIYKDIPSGE